MASAEEKAVITALLQDFHNFNSYFQGQPGIRSGAFKAEQNTEQLQEGNTLQSLRESFIRREYRFFQRASSRK